MNETTEERGDAWEYGHAVPDVTEIPLVDLAPHEDRVLDAAIRRLVEDVVSQTEITAGFGNIT